MRTKIIIVKMRVNNSTVKYLVSAPFLPKTELGVGVYKYKVL